mgnify:CR=1 FL=1
MKKLLRIVVYMVLALCIYFCTLFFLTEIDSRIQLGILTISFGLFIYLGANLIKNIIEIVQPYKFLIGNKVELDECVVRKETQIGSLTILCDKIGKIGYVLVDELAIESLGNIKIFQQIEYGKIRTIANYIIIMDYFPDISSRQSEVVDRMLNSAMTKSEERKKIKGLINRKYILCTFSSNLSDEQIKKFIFSANFSSMIYLPLIVDTESEVVYHASISLDSFWVKGKVFEDLAQIVSSVF